MAKIVYQIDAQAEKAVRSMVRLEQATAGVNRKMQRMGRAGTKTTSEFARQVRNMVMGWASVGAAIGVVRRGFQMYNQDVLLNVQHVKSLMTASKELMFMGQNWKRTVALRRELGKFGVRTGIPAEELARTKTEIASRMSWASSERRQKTQQAIINLAKTGDLPASSYVPALAKLQTIYRKIDPSVAANLVAAAAERAAVPRSQIQEPLAKGFAGGVVGRLTPQQAAGMTSFLTGIAPTPDVAGQQMVMMMRKMMTLTPKQMARYGITPEMTGLERLAKIRQAKPSATELKAVLGERVMANVQIMFRRWSSLQEDIKFMAKRAIPGRDILGERIAHVRRTDPEYRRLEAAARLEQAKAFARREQGAKALESENFLKFIEYKMIREGRSPLNREMNLALYKMLRFLTPGAGFGAPVIGFMSEDEIGEYNAISEGRGMLDVAAKNLNDAANKLRKTDVAQPDPVVEE